MRHARRVLVLTVLWMRIASGKHTKRYGNPPFFMGKSTISMAIFNSELLNYQRVLRATGGGRAHLMFVGFMKPSHRILW
jgi:hypothetical protein